VALDGTVTMTVTQADSGGLTVSLSTSNLQAGLPCPPWPGAAACRSRAAARWPTAAPPPPAAPGRPAA
jgi:hypothetical protein